MSQQPLESLSATDQPSGHAAITEPEGLSEEMKIELSKIREVTLSAERALRIKPPKRPSAENEHHLLVLMNTGVINNSMSMHEQLETIKMLRGAIKSLQRGSRNTLGFSALHMYLKSPLRLR